MTKRIADRELTDRNWDQEDEGEETGMFSVASEDILKSRVIKTAKRRNIGEGYNSRIADKELMDRNLGHEGEKAETFPIASEDILKSRVIKTAMRRIIVDGYNSGAFKGFKAFAPTPSPTSGRTTAGFPGFKGLTALTNGNSITPTFGGFSIAASSKATPGLMFNSPASPTKASADITGKQTNGSSTPSNTQSSCISANRKEYNEQLTSLNCFVRDWITGYVNDNSLCDLNPIFRWYEGNLASIKKTYEAGSAAAAPAAGDSEEEEKKKKQADPPLPPPP